MEDLQLVDDDSIKLSNEFIQKYTRLQINKKNIGLDVKELRKSYEEQGLPTADVIRAFNKMRKERKDGEDKIAQIEMFKEWLRKDRTTQDLVNELDA